MDLQGTRFGQLMIILHLCTQMIFMGNPSLTYSLNHPKKTKRAGPTGMSLAAVITEITGCSIETWYFALSLELTPIFPMLKFAPSILLSMEYLVDEI